MHRRTTLVLLLAVLFTSVLSSQESQLIDFKIKDQFNREHTDEDYRGSIVVLLGSDKGGAPFNDLWGRAIRQAMAGEPGFKKVVFLPYADVRGVPFFLKGSVCGVTTTRSFFAAYSKSTSSVVHSGKTSMARSTSQPL